MYSTHARSMMLSRRLRERKTAADGNNRAPSCPPPHLPPPVVSVFESGVVVRDWATFPVQDFLTAVGRRKEGKLQPRSAFASFSASSSVPAYGAAAAARKSCVNNNISRRERNGRVRTGEAVSTIWKGLTEEVR
eukprot:GHVS01071539.1.p1 GENE.GHVS01071539.1~~GHVS01071539.1.p1  ORF type:complete len:134 (+),score=30.95 GHVS01071539.1:144-545(+)